MLLIRLKFPLYFVKGSNCMRKVKNKNMFSTTARRPVELMRHSFLRRPAFRPSVRNNILLLYLLSNLILQRPIYCHILLAPWSSCACAILVQSGSPGAPQGDLVQKKSQCVSQRLSWSLILLDTLSRCGVYQFGPVILHVWFDIYKSISLIFIIFQGIFIRKSNKIGFFSSLDIGEHVSPVQVILITMG